MVENSSQSSSVKERASRRIRGLGSRYLTSSMFIEIQGGDARPSDIQIFPIRLTGATVEDLNSIDWAATIEWEVLRELLDRQREPSPLTPENVRRRMDRRSTDVSQMCQRQLQDRSPQERCH